METSNRVLILLPIVPCIDWVPVATISTRKDIELFPAVTLVSFTDGLLGNGSGIPYLYLTPLDFTAQDLAVSATVRVYVPPMLPNKLYVDRTLLIDITFLR